MTKRDGTSGRGFSIIELLVVLGILAGFVAIAFPRLAALSAGYRLDAASSGLVAQIQRARFRAIAEKVRHRVAFANDGEEFTICKEKGNTGSNDFSTACVTRPVDESNAVAMTGGGGQAIVFDTRGFATPASGVLLTLSHVHGNSSQISVAPTGRVTIQ